WPPFFAGTTAPPPTPSLPLSRPPSRPFYASLPATSRLRHWKAALVSTSSSTLPLPPPSSLPPPSTWVRRKAPANGSPNTGPRTKRSLEYRSPTWRRCSFLWLPRQRLGTWRPSSSMPWPGGGSPCRRRQMDGGRWGSEEGRAGIRERP
ncbi:hypothetical protein NGA_0425800, partial [Nannochloropsis gaditana CCMP526]|uniref:uncharacterized protein n=1 Tax=Nannochloropsis gaditana (strain CCMP526) TaxID=1093141 RepID=UPI00029F7114